MAEFKDVLPCMQAMDKVVRLDGGFVVLLFCRSHELVELYYSLMRDIITEFGIYKQFVKWQILCDGKTKCLYVFINHI